MKNVILICLISFSVFTSVAQENGNRTPRSLHKFLNAAKQIFNSPRLQRSNPLPCKEEVQTDYEKNTDTSSSGSNTPKRRMSLNNDDVSGSFDSTQSNSDEDQRSILDSFDIDTFQKELEKGEEGEIAKKWGEYTKEYAEIVSHCIIPLKGFSYTMNAEDYNNGKENLDQIKNRIPFSEKSQKIHKFMEDLSYELETKSLFSEK